MFLGLFFMMIIVFLFVLSIGSTIIRGIFGLFLGIFHRLFGNKEHSQYTQQQSQSRQSTTTDKGQKSGKIFDKSDGEYVDFEEIKE